MSTITGPGESFADARHVAGQLAFWGQQNQRRFAEFRERLRPFHFAINTDTADRTAWPAVASVSMIKKAACRQLGFLAG